MNDAQYRHLSPTVQALSNGMTVVCEHLPYVHSASLGVWIRTGSVNENAQHAGISHFLEHMLFKGTETRSARDLMHAIESKGGQINAFTSREHTCLYVRTLDRHVSGGFDILADIIKHSTFCDLEKERNVILEEIASGRDMPEDHVHDLLSDQCWPTHPMGRPIAGYEETVADTGLDEIRAYKDRWYRPEQMYVCIVGRFDESAFIQQVADAFDAIPAGSAQNGVQAPAFGAGLKIVERDIAQNHVACGFMGTPVTSPERYVYDMLSSTLGGGATSRLFESIREEAGLAYSIYSFNAMYVAAGVLGFYAAVGPENLQHGLDLARGELRKLQDEPVPEEELSSNREQLKGALLLALEGTFNRMARMVRSLMLFDRIVPVEEVLDAVDRVTQDDVQRLAQALFEPDKCALAVLGPAGETEPVLL